MLKQPRRDRARRNSRQPALPLTPQQAPTPPTGVPTPPVQLQQPPAEHPQPHNNMTRAQSDARFLELIGDQLNNSLNYQGQPVLQTAQQQIHQLFRIDTVTPAFLQTKRFKHTDTINFTFSQEMIVHSPHQIAHGDDWDHQDLTVSATFDRAEQGHHILANVAALLTQHINDNFCNGTA